MKHLFFAAVLFTAATSCKKDASTPPPPAAEISIKASDVRQQFTAGKKIHFFDAKLDGAITLKAPAEGKDQTWDFSNLVEESTSTSILAEPGPAYAPSGYSIKTKFMYINGQMEPTAYEYKISEAGWLALGMTTPGGFTLSFPDIGGTIQYKAQASKFDKPVLYSPSFPIKYGASESVENSVRADHFTVDAPALGLNKTPGAQTYTVSSAAKCIASGKMKLKGFPNEMRVLVVKMHQHHSTNYFLGGAPAPKPMLDLLHLTDGTSFDSDWYDFYSADGQGYLGTLGVDNTNKVTLAGFVKN